MGHDMTDGLHIREATLDDAFGIADFNRAMAWESEGRRIDPAVALAGVRQGIARADLCRYFVAEFCGKLVGQLMITYEWSDWRAGVFWWIQSVYVGPDHRRQGVFGALLEHVRALARTDAGVCGLRLYVEAENTSARQTYERLGFRQSGHVVYECDWRSDPRGEQR